MRRALCLRNEHSSRIADFVEAECPKCGASLGRFREDVGIDIHVRLDEEEPMSDNDMPKGNSSQPLAERLASRFPSQRRATREGGQAAWRSHARHVDTTRVGRHRRRTSRTRVGREANVRPYAKEIASEIDRKAEAKATKLASAQIREVEEEVPRARVGRSRP